MNEDQRVESVNECWMEVKLKRKLGEGYPNGVHPSRRPGRHRV